MIRFSSRRSAFRPLLLALSLSTSLTCPSWAWAQAGEDLSTLVKANRTDFDAANRLYRASVKRGDLATVLAKVEALSQSGSPAARAAAGRLRAELLWQDGDREGALAAADAALANETGPDGYRLKAELLDALGRIAEAVPLYRQAQEQEHDRAVKRRIALRLAMIDAVRRPDTLLRYASDAPPAQARRLADILALLGRPKAALALGGSGGDVGDRLTAAQWALAAGEAGPARDVAKAALASAKTPDDRRYALALVVEAYRNAGDLIGALTFLDTLPPNELVANAKVDVLLELGRTKAAIAAIEGPKPRVAWPLDRGARFVRRPGGGRGRVCPPDRGRPASGGPLCPAGCASSDARGRGAGPGGLAADVRGQSRAGRRADCGCAGDDRHGPSGSGGRDAGGQRGRPGGGDGDASVPVRDLSGSRRHGQGAGRVAGGRARRHRRAAPARYRRWL
ncbi:hypothetical protein P0F65_09670 [Sphingomonas sp. I4]